MPREGERAGEEVGRSVLDGVWFKGGSQGCWEGLEPPSPTLSPSVTSWERGLPEHSVGTLGQSCFVWGLQGDSHTGVSPLLPRIPRLDPEERG